jgi:hypothetical protein
MSYLRYLCLFAYSGVLGFFFASSCVLCVKCCQILLIATSVFSDFI